jgi:hypothetical protein
MPKTGVAVNKQNWNLNTQENLNTLINIKLEAKHMSKASQNNHEGIM